MKTRSILTATFCLLAATLAIPSEAATVYYSDRDTFLTVAPPGPTITFNGLAPSGGTISINNKTYEGVKFSNAEGNLLAISPTRATTFYQWNSQDTAVGYYYGSKIRAILPSGQFMVGADVMVAEYKKGGVSAPITATLTFVDNSTFEMTRETFARPERAFMGFTSDKEIKEISFHTPGTTANWFPFAIIDNVRIAVPEPSSSLLLILGGLPFFLFFRRR